jgi:hypothetical protein
MSGEADCEQKKSEWEKARPRWYKLDTPWKELILSWRTLRKYYVHLRRRFEDVSIIFSMLGASMEHVIRNLREVCTQDTQNGKQP